jgi:acyl-CoA dehydrogenase
MSTRIPDEIAQFAETVRRFVKEEVLPINQKIEEEGKVPQHIRDKVRDLGLFGATIPVEYGGLGLGCLGYCLVSQEIAQCHPAIRGLIGVNNGIGSKGILLDGTEEQKKKYLSAMAIGEKTSSFALTEPSAGSDASNIQTTAVKKGSKWVINGMKHFITNAPYADVFTVMALTDREKKAKGGITAFLVEKGTGGLSIGKTQKAMYDGGSKQAEVIFEDCEVDENCIIGGPRNVGMGFATAMKTLDDGRLTISATAIGLARRALIRENQGPVRESDIHQPGNTMDAGRQRHRNLRSRMHDARCGVEIGRG